MLMHKPSQYRGFPDILYFKMETEDNRERNAREEGEVRGGVPDVC